MAGGSAPSTSTGVMTVVSTSATVMVSVSATIATFSPGLTRARMRTTFRAPPMIPEICMDLDLLCTPTCWDLVIPVIFREPVREKSLRDLHNLLPPFHHAPQQRGAQGDQSDADQDRRDRPREEDGDVAVRDSERLAERPFDHGPEDEGQDDRGGGELQLAHQVADDA